MIFKVGDCVKATELCIDKTITGTFIIGKIELIDINFKYPYLVRSIINPARTMYFELKEIKKLTDAELILELL